MTTVTVWHDPKQHTEHCYCGLKAKKHIAYGTGCANVCGIHAKVIGNRKGGFVKTGPPQPAGEE